MAWRHRRAAHWGLLAGLVLALTLPLAAAQSQVAATAEIADTACDESGTTAELLFACRLKRAEAGDRESQFLVGNLYYFGRGTAQDPTEARKWFRKAADQGHPIAETNIGNMYATGRGLPRDDAAAVDWYRRASAQNYAPAQAALSTMMAAGRGGLAVDVTQAMALNRRAVDQGYVPAMLNLGGMLMRGAGDARDVGGALGLYRAASKRGNKPAGHYLDTFLKNRQRTAVTAAEARQHRDVTSSLVRPVAVGDIVYLVDQRDDWQQVYFAETGDAGWVQNADLRAPGAKPAATGVAGHPGSAVVPGVPLVNANQQTASCPNKPEKGAHYLDNCVATGCYRTYDNGCSIYLSPSPCAAQSLTQSLTQRLGQSLGLQLPQANGACANGVPPQTQLPSLFPSTGNDPSDNERSGGW